MKNFKLYLLAVFVILLFNSCENEEDILVDTPTDTEILARNSNPLANRGPTITFGRYYGKCQGNQCVEIFRLIENTLLEDTVDNYPVLGSMYQGKFTSFKGSDRVETVRILPEFPIELLNSKRTVFGTPDAGDWGGIYLEYQDAGVHRYWLVDLETSNINKSLRPYVELIDKTVNEINDINNLN